jgi:hypothetical protein
MTPKRTFKEWQDLTYDIVSGVIEPPEGETGDEEIELEDFLDDLREMIFHEAKQE